jgi:hypothetical protein
MIFDTKENTEVNKSYILNTNMQCAIGDELFILQRNRLVSQKAFQATKSFSNKISYATQSIDTVFKGDIFFKYSISKDHIIIQSQLEPTAKLKYKWENGSNDNYYGIDIFEDGSIGKGYIFFDNYAKLLQDTWNDGIYFKEIDYTNVIPSDFEYEFKYLGNVNNILKIQFRIIYKNKIVSDESYIYEYDLNNGDIISFKSINIQILKSDNQVLKYKVIKEGDLVWVK